MKHRLPRLAASVVLSTSSKSTLKRRWACALVLLAVSSSVSAATYNVGSGQTYPTLNSLPALNPGDLVQVNPGTYNEVVRWTRGGTAASPITIRGVGASRPVVDATGKTVDGALPNPRAVFQIEGSYITVENIEFINARNGNNGSGIRVTSTNGVTTNFVTIRNCKITYCDMGMQSDTNDNLLIESCEIAYNGTSAFAGGSHNLYLNGNKTTLRFCFIHDSLYGQNFKTRGHYTELFYNTIAYSQDGELGFVDSANTATANSNAVMIGNVVVAKPRDSAWNHIRFIQFGQDGGGTHAGTLYAINNTFLAGDNRINFVDVNVAGAAAAITNTIFDVSSTIGNGTISGSNNWMLSTAAIPPGVSNTVLGSSSGLTNPAARNFHLVAGSQCINAGTNSPSYVDGNGATQSGVPTLEYVNDFSSTARSVNGTLDIGAYELPGTATPPSITAQPANVTVTAGQTASFSVAASGTATLTYQWQKNGANISGANGTTYTTPATTTADNASTFRCVVSNSAGSATSNNATLTVNAAVTPPSITTQPANVTVTAGQTASFSVAASGTATLTYQWQKNGANISGATGTTYTTPATSTADNASTFRCVVSNSAGSATSNNATLTVNAAATPPSITTQPANVTVTAGQTASFSVAASGTATLTYQWQKNGANISGATGTTYTTPATSTADNASTFRCVVSNSAGSATSNNATLTVNAAATAPSITAQPANVTVTAGQTASFSIAASGTATLTYQWQRNGTNISGATATSYTTPATTTADNASTFRCVVSNSAGSATSNSATLTVNAAATAPSITAQPANVTVTAGQTASFSIAASGTATLTYQWQKNGANISGATGTTYTTPATSTADNASTFRCVVSNSAGSATSNNATLTVNAAVTAPSITAQPANVTVTAGQTASFSVAASGTATLTYQWQKNGANISGATGTSYTTPATSTADNASTFRCVVTNSAGSATSNNATLTVNAVSGTDTVWVEDVIPGGGAPASDGGDGWSWISANPAPLSGSLANQSAIAAGEHQHYFTGATQTLTVNTGDTLIAYVYLDPANPPSEVMLQWNNGSWEHRAYWGANALAWGTDGTVSRFNMGALPAAGQWVRLQIPASSVGLEGSVLTGMAFTLNGGRATFDHAGKGPFVAAESPFGGVAWAIPGTVQAEDFDNGGEGIAYHDLDAGNSGGAYRSTDVDIRACSDTGGGNQVGWTGAGEWLRYTVNIASTGSYTATARMAAGGTGGAIHYELDGSAISGSIAIPYSGGYDTWENVTTTVNLTAGQHILRVVIENSGFDMNYFAFSSTNQPPVITSAAIAAPVSATTGQTVTFTTAASDPNGDALTYSWNFGDGSTASGASATHAYSAAGTYSAVVTVTDGKGGTVSSSVNVTVTAVVATSIAINSGGSAAGAFSADGFVSGGSSYTTSSAINLTGTATPAPAAVYQSERYGNFTYTITGLTSGASYTVRLHFAEIWWNAVNQRVFNVAINGSQVLANFDVFAAAGGNFKAISRDFTATAVNGQIAIAYTTVKDNAKSSGIEIISGAGGAAVRSVAADDTAVSSIDLGTVPANRSFKLKLDAPDSGKAVKLGWKSTVPANLPSGIRVSGGFVGGKPTKPGTYTFNIQIKGKLTSATNSYTLTVAP